jgi:hypothetical protein
MPEPTSSGPRPELIPAAARDQWLALAQVLDEIDPVPCGIDDPEAWWPVRKPFGTATQRAIAACHGCPAQGACLSYALAADERFGIWGGTLPDDRRAMRWAHDSDTTAPQHGSGAVRGP